MLLNSDWKWWLAGLALWLGGGVAQATDVFKCTASGQVTYQQAPCPRGVAQEHIALADSEPGAPAPPPLLPDAPPAPVAPPPPAATFEPVPVMYGCVKATDNKPYLSDNGSPPPYQVPYGMVADGGSLMNQASGTAPEFNRGKVTAGLVANNYVWVQDRCRALSPQETCEALQGELDKNDKLLRNAFKSQQAPFEARDKQLRAQLQSCH
jgi:hypothetical protein